MTLEQQVYQNDVKLHKLIREVETLKKKLAQMEADGKKCNHPKVKIESIGDGYEKWCPDCEKYLVL